jgi:hemolysin activation/secretion protein
LTRHPSLSPACRIALKVVLAIPFGVPALAQDYERVAPRQPAAPGPPPAFVPPAPAPPSVAAPNRVLLAKLRGLKLTDSIAKLKRNGASGEGVAIDGLPMLDAPELRERLAAFLGKTLTFGGLDAISQTIIAWYRDHDHPFVDVAFPEQDIGNGVIQGVVTEFRVGKVAVQGNEWFSSALLAEQVRAAAGDAIDARRLQEDIAWLNQNPFREVSVLAQRGDAPATTDLVLRTADRFPVRLYGGYDNTGTPVLGHDRWTLGINWGNAFWNDQQLSYQFTSSDDFWHRREDIPGRPSDPTFVAHAVNYVAPLPWRDKIDIFGSYSKAAPRLGPDIGLTGISGQASVRYVMPLPGAPGLTHQLQIGYDFKTSNNNLEFGGLQVTNVTTEIDQFPLVYDLAVTDAFGQTAIQNNFVVSPGNLTAGNKDAAFQAQANSPFAKSKYIYDMVRLTRTTRLPQDASWVMRVIEQVSDRDLLPSEQLGAGGFDSVRGYDERAANGSIGLLITAELRTPPFQPVKLLRGTEIGEQAQLLAFWDYGSVREKQTAPGARSSSELESVGMGLRYSVARVLDFRLDYGWQLRKLPGAAGRSQLGHLSVTVSY